MVMVRRVADRLISLAAALAALALVAEVVVTLIDVVGRFFGAPIYGSQDITTMAMVVLVFGAMALCDRRGGHIAVDLAQPFFGPALNRAIDVAAASIGAAIFLALAYAVWDSLQLSVLLNLSTNLLQLPKAWFQGALVAMSAIAALGMILRAIELAFLGRDVREEGAGGAVAQADAEPALKDAASRR